MKKILLQLLFYSAFLHSQEINFDLFSAAVENSSLIIKNNSGKIIFTRNFSNPQISPVDFDDDGINELLIQDSSSVNNKPVYKLYFCNTVDSFYIADSINSGFYQPLILFSEEIGSMIVVTGNPLFEKYSSEDFLFLPAVCSKYEDGVLFPVNDEVYEIYLNENDIILNFLDEYFSSNINNCNSTQNIKGAIASVYINYLNAGEISVASQ